MIQVYTGYGKGKTTAAIGASVRASGAGFRVVFIEFDKGPDLAEEYSSEQSTLKCISNINFYSYGKSRINLDGSFRFDNTNDDFDEFSRAIVKAREMIVDKAVDVIVLDEILAGLVSNLATEDVVASIIQLAKTQPHKELILTGHQFPVTLAEEVDLVTNMTKIKHYYDRGVKARKGFEF